MRPDLILLFLASGAICVRLLTFRRGRSRHRWPVALLAWVLIASTGSTALDIALGRFGGDGHHWGLVGVHVVLCALVYSARGNVAHILRVRT